MPLEIAIKELPLSGIRSREQLALFVLASFGVTDMPSTQEEVQKAMPDVVILLAFMDAGRKGEGLKVSDLLPKVDLKQTALYSRIRVFVNASLVYKAKGSLYKLKERSLADTLKYRVWKDIESRFSSITDVAKELDNKMKEPAPQQTKLEPIQAPAESSEPEDQSV